MGSGPRALLYDGVEHEAPAVPAVAYSLSHAAKAEEQGRAEGMGQDDAPVKAAAPDGAHQVEEADQFPCRRREETVEKVEAVVQVPWRRVFHGPQLSIQGCLRARRKGVAITMSPSQLGRYMIVFQSLLTPIKRLYRTS